MNSKPLTVSTVLSESWQLTSGLKRPVFLLSLLIFLLITIGMIAHLYLIYFPKINQMIEIISAQRYQTALAISQGLPPPPRSFPKITTPIFTQVVMAIILFVIGMGVWFLTAMQVLLGIRQSIGLSSTINKIFYECKKVSFDILSLYTIIAMIIVFLKILDTIWDQIGVIGILFHTLLNFSFIAFFIAMQAFSIPLIIIKRYDMIKALNQGLRVAFKHGKLLVPLFFILGVLQVVSVFTLGIGLIWVLPMYYAAIGICFRNIYGLKKTTSF